MQIDLHLVQKTITQPDFFRYWVKVRDIPENTEPTLSRPLFADEAAFEAAFRGYYTVLYRVVFRVLKKEDASEDVVQDLFVKLWNKRDSFLIAGSLKAYLCQSAVNAAYDHLRKYKKEYAGEELEVVNQSGGNQTEEYLNARDMEKRIALALEKLPPACRNVFILSREEELSYKEIAEALNISVKTVENQMGKALKILREELQPHLENLIKMLILFFISIVA